jgi:hypothetical protein
MKNVDQFIEYIKKLLNKKGHHPNCNRIENKDPDECTFCTRIYKLYPEEFFRDK